MGFSLKSLPQCHSRHTLAAGIESVKEQYRLFFLHIGLQRYSKYGRKPPIQQLSVFFLTKIAQNYHLNSFNSLCSQHSISSLEGSFKRYFDINRFSSMPKENEVIRNRVIKIAILMFGISLSDEVHEYMFFVSLRGCIAVGMDLLQ